MTVAKSDLATCRDLVEWRRDIDPADWDIALAKLNGHPLQSALWGESRRAADGIEDQRWMAFDQGVAVAMLRLEERRAPLLGKIGWAPRGPSGRLADLGSLTSQLRAAGVVMLVTDPWRARPSGELAQAPAKAPRTIWLDLSVGRDAAMARLDQQWRSRVRRAQKLGVTVSSTRAEEDIQQFYRLCSDVSEAKRFKLPGSLPLMRRLLRDPPGGPVEARLFLARKDDQMGAGAFILRCGSSIHYFWGAADRAFSKDRMGEAVQWAAIEWGIEQGCRRYDLEGIDPEHNPGVYQFKRKMGGDEVTLAGKTFTPLTPVGRVAAWFVRRWL